MAEFYAQGDAEHKRGLPISRYLGPPPPRGGWTAPWPSSTLRATRSTSAGCPSAATWVLPPPVVGGPLHGRVLRSGRRGAQARAAHQPLPGSSPPPWWVDRSMAEFYAQGDAEHKRGLPISRYLGP